MTDARNKELMISPSITHAIIEAATKAVAGGVLRTYSSEWNPLQAKFDSDVVGMADIPLEGFSVSCAFGRECRGLQAIKCVATGNHLWWAASSPQGEVIMFGKIAMPGESPMNSLVLSSGFAMEGSQIRVKSFKIDVTKVLF